MKASQESPFTADVPFSLSKCSVFLALNKLIQYSNILKYPLDVSSVGKRQQCMKWIFFHFQGTKAKVRGAVILYVTLETVTLERIMRGRDMMPWGMDKYLTDLVLRRDRMAERLSQHLVKEAQPCCGYESCLSTSSNGIVCCGH